MMKIKFKNIELTPAQYQILLDSLRLFFMQNVIDCECTNWDVEQYVLAHYSDNIATLKSIFLDNAVETKCKIHKNKKCRKKH